MLVSHQSLTINLPAGTTYDPATGLLKMFIGDHNLAVGTNIKLTADSLSFTCTTDGNTSVKTYPRASGTGANAGTPDPAYNTALAILLMVYHLLLQVQLIILLMVFYKSLRMLMDLL